MKLLFLAVVALVAASSIEAQQFQYTVDGLYQAFVSPANTVVNGMIKPVHSKSIGYASVMIYG